MQRAACLCFALGTMCLEYSKRLRGRARDIAEEEDSVAGAAPICSAQTEAYV